MVGSEKWVDVIRECCELKRETYKGYVWRYVGKEAIQWS